MKFLRIVAIELILLLMTTVLSSCVETPPMDMNSTPGETDASNEVNVPVPSEADVFDNVNKPLNEKQISMLVPDDIRGNYVVNHVTIDRRQTNGKEDIVYVNINMSEETESLLRERTAYYIFTINYYDVGGWILDQWEKLQFDTTSYYPLSPPDEHVLEDALEDYCDYTLRSSVTDNYENGLCTYVFDINEKTPNGTRIGEVSVVSIFDYNRGHWDASIDSEETTVNWDVSGFWLGYYSDTSGIAEIDYSLIMYVADITDTTVHVSGRISKRLLDEHFDETVNYESDNHFFTFRILENGGENVGYEIRIKFTEYGSRFCDGDLWREDESLFA